MSDRLLAEFLGTALLLVGVVGSGIMAASLSPDNIGVDYCCVIYAFDESPVQKGVFWAGSNDGLVHVSRDGGKKWENVTANLPDLPPLGTVPTVQMPVPSS